MQRAAAVRAARESMAAATAWSAAPAVGGLERAPANIEEEEEDDGGQYEDEGLDGPDGNLGDGAADGALGDGADIYRVGGANLQQMAPAGEDGQEGGPILGGEEAAQRHTDTAVR